MERKTSRNLYLASIVIFVVGIVLFIVAGGAASSASSTNSTSLGAGAGIMAIVSLLLYIVAAVLATVAWVGALIKTAKLGQWLWFVLLLLFSGIMMLVYIFAGPTEPKAATMAA